MMMSSANRIDSGSSENSALSGDEAGKELAVSQQFGLMTQYLGIVLFTVMTAAGAFIIIPLPFTPIPITFQTLAALLSGYFLGNKKGPLSQLLYLVIGGLGIPWFASNRYGLEAVFGVTGGYLFGFILGSWIIGHFHLRERRGQDLMRTVLIFLLATVGIYFCGIIGMLIGLQVGFVAVLQLGVFPFIPGDIWKLLFGICIIFGDSFVQKKLDSNEIVAASELEPQKYDISSAISKKKIQIMGIFLCETVLLLIFIGYLFSNGHLPPAFLPAISILTVGVLLIPVIWIVLKFISKQRRN